MRQTRFGGLEPGLRQEPGSLKPSETLAQTGLTRKTGILGQVSSLSAQTTRIDEALVDTQLSMPRVRTGHFMNPVYLVYLVCPNKSAGLSKPGSTTNLV